jgi:argininosuccinate lyase
VRTLEIDAGRMRAALDAGFSQATDLAEWLMTRFATDYRTAHRVVHRAVHLGPAAAALNAHALAMAALEVVGVPWRLDDAELKAVLDPATLVNSRGVLGGAAPRSVSAMLTQMRARASELRAAAAERRQAIDAAEDAVRSRASNLARPRNVTDND